MLYDQTIVSVSIDNLNNGDNVHEQTRRNVLIANINNCDNVHEKIGGMF